MILFLLMVVVGSAIGMCEEEEITIESNDVTQPLIKKENNRIKTKFEELPFEQLDYIAQFIAIDAADELIQKLKNDPNDCIKTLAFQAFLHRRGSWCATLYLQGDLGLLKRGLNENGLTLARKVIAYQNKEQLEAETLSHMGRPVEDPRLLVAFRDFPRVIFNRAYQHAQNGGNSLENGSASDLIVTSMENHADRRYRQQGFNAWFGCCCAVVRVWLGISVCILIVMTPFSIWKTFNK